MKKPVKTLLYILVILLILFLIYLFFINKQVVAPTKNMAISQIASSPSPPNFVGKEDILKNALNLFIEKKKAVVDMTNGPCLGKIADDWVLDIAHNPRLPVDDKAENQCPEFREGKVHHFIELDPNGNLIREN